MASYSLKLFIKNCSQTASNEDMVTIDSLQEVVRVLSDGAIADPYDLPFSHNVTRLAILYTIVRYDPSRSFRVNDFHVI